MPNLKNHGRLHKKIAQFWVDQRTYVRILLQAREEFWNIFSNLMFQLLYAPFWPA